MSHLLKEMIITAYFLVGLIVLLITPLSDTAKNGYDSLVRDYFRSEKYFEKLVGVFGLFAWGIIIVLILCIYPVIILTRYIFSKKLTSNEKNKKLTTEKITDPTYNRVTEERDYKKLFTKKIVEIRRFKYDNANRLVEINSYDHSEKQLSTVKNYYNELGQKYATTMQRPQTEYPIRSFFLFDSQNRHIAHYGELDSGHQYCHEFAYDEKGQQHITIMSNLRRDLDLHDIFQNALKKQKEKSNPKTIFPKNFNRRSNSIRSWNCEICDGDETTGCLYHDSSECPKFT